MAKFITFVLVSALLVNFVGCDITAESQPGSAGEQGVIGPQGEKGDPGVNGVNGNDGVPGQDGEDGKDFKSCLSDFVCPDGYECNPQGICLEKVEEMTKPALDPECAEDIDYVVRTVYPRSPDSYGITISLSDADNVNDAELFEFEIHACRSVILDGLFIGFHTYGVFDEDENQEEADPEGLVLPDWTTRFYDFNLLQDGEVVYHAELASEMSISDTDISAQFRGEARHLAAGNSVTFTFSASIRPDYPASSSFVTGIGDQLGGLIFSTPPDPNLLGRRIPWGLFITYPQQINIVP